jgi:hypothetical protein
MSDVEVSFESTNVRTEITRWYTVTGAPIIETSVNGRSNLVRKFSPISVRFVFVDGEVSDRPMVVPEINMHDRKNWPKWLHELYTLACEDEQAKYKVLV